MSPLVSSKSAGERTLAAVVAFIFVAPHVLRTGCGDHRQQKDESSEQPGHSAVALTPAHGARLSIY